MTNFKYIARIVKSWLVLNSLLLISCEKDFISGPTENFLLSDKFSKPTNLKIGNTYPNSFTLSWNKNADAQAYRLYIAKDSLFYDMLPGYPILKITDTVYQVNSQVVPNQKYYAKIIAENSKNEKSMFSETVETITPNADAIMYLVSNPFPFSVIIKPNSSENITMDFNWLSFSFQFFIGFGEKVTHTTGDKEVVIHSTFDKLFALSKSNGDILWRNSFKGISTIPTLSNNHVFIPSDDGNVYALDKNTGTEMWRINTYSPVQCSPTVDESMMYVGNNAGKFFAIEIETGDISWTFQASSRIASNPVINRNNVIFGTQDGDVYAIDTKTGLYSWSFKTNNVIVSSPVVQNDLVFFSSQNGVIYAFDITNGKLKWQKSTGINSDFSLDTVKDKLVFCGNDALLRFFDTTKGLLLWEQLLNQLPTTQFTVSNFDKIYLPGTGIDNNEVTIIDVENKKETVMIADKNGRGQIYSHLLIEAGDGAMSYPSTSGNK